MYHLCQRKKRKQKLVKENKLVKSANLLVFVLLIF